MLSYYRGEWGLGVLSRYRTQCYHIIAANGGWESYHVITHSVIILSRLMGAESLIKLSHTVLSYYRGEWGWETYHGITHSVIILSRRMGAGSLVDRYVRYLKKVFRSSSCRYQTDSIGCHAWIYLLWIYLN